MIQQEKYILNKFKYIFEDLNIKDVKFWIAGGCLRSLFSGEKLKSDIDLFFPTKDEWDKLYNRFIEKNIKVILKNKNTIKLLYKSKYNIDFVKKYFKDEKETIENFDFTVCSVALNINKEQFFYHKTFFIDLSARKLVINSLPYPLSTLQRLQKYIFKGYSACNGTLLEIAKAISKLDLDDPEQNIFEFYEDGSPKFYKID